MAASYETKIKEQASSYLNPGEQAQAAFMARPRGAVMAAAGGVVGGELGGRKIRQQANAADGVGLTLASPMALVLTEERLIVLSISAPIALGKGGDVKGLVSAVPLASVESIKTRRLLVGKVVELTVDGQTFKLEVGAGADVGGFSDTFSRLKATPSAA